jgi:hypothetical protein
MLSAIRAKNREPANQPHPHPVSIQMPVQQLCAAAVTANAPVEAANPVGAKENVPESGPPGEKAWLYHYRMNSGSASEQHH